MREIHISEEAEAWIELCYKNIVQLEHTHINHIL